MRRMVLSASLAGRDLGSACSDRQLPDWVLLAVLPGLVLSNLVDPVIKGTLD